MELRDIPLFPLGNLLFPGFEVELHIFEERYKRLVADSLAEGGRFGVLGIERGVEAGGEATPYRVGTLAQITQLKELDGGRFYMSAAGLERFAVEELDTGSKPYLRGRVRLWPDEDVPEVAPELRERTVALFNEYLSSLVAATGHAPAEWGVTLPLELPSDARVCSLLISTLLQVPEAERQQLLEAPSPAARLLVATSLMARELALMKTTRAAPAVYPGSLGDSFSEN